VEKNQKFFGLGLMTMLFLTSLGVCSLIGSVFLFIDDMKVRRQALLQGIIAILCCVTYGLYLKNYEKSKRLHLKSGSASATASDVPKSDISSASETEGKKKK